MARNHLQNLVMHNSIFNRLWNTAAIVIIIYRIISTIREHIVANKSLAGVRKLIRIDESADLRIVISGLQIIEPGLGWVLLCIRRGCPPPGRCFFRCVPCRKREWNWYVPASQQASCLASQTRFHWDNPKPLKISGIVLTSAVVSQRRCLLVYVIRYYLTCLDL